LGPPILPSIHGTNADYLLSTGYATIMTPDHVNDALYVATKTSYKNSDFGEQELDIQMFAKLIQYKVLDEVLAIARANTIVSDSALELYKDLQAYDRYERGFNF
jgi:hypothetical protein